MGRRSTANDGHPRGVSTVPAASFSANLCDGLFTHYKREEDATMQSGNLDEELSRMSDIVDHLTANSMVLLNESFAAAHEREGSEIARQIVGALVEKRIKMFFVTHLYAFALRIVHRGSRNRTRRTPTLQWLSSACWARRCLRSSTARPGSRPNRTLVSRHSLLP
jgi:MutS domain V